MLGLVWDLDKNFTFVCQFVNRFHSYFDPYVDGSTRVVQFFYVLPFVKLKINCSIFT